MTPAASSAVSARRASPAARVTQVLLRLRRELRGAPPKPRGLASARRMTSRTSSPVSGSSRSSSERDSSGEITEKNGFSVVAATSESQPFSTDRQQHVLLGLGEAVHLVEEEHGALAARGQRAAGVVDDRAHVLDRGAHRRQFVVAAPGGEQVGDRRLSAARRPHQDQAGRRVALGDAAQRAAGADQRALPDDLV